MSMRVLGPVLAAGILVAGGTVAGVPPLPLVEGVTLQGRTFRLDLPPKGLVVRGEIGLLCAEALDGRVVHRAAKERLFETRATITPGGEYLLMFPEGQHYGGSKGGKVNTMLAYRSSDKGHTWQGPSEAFDIDYSQHGFVPLIPRGSKRIYAFGTQPIPEKYDWGHGLHENAPIGFRWSDDDGHTWSPVKLIEPVNDPDFKGMSVMRMCETGSGAWIIGAHEGDWSVKPLRTRQYFLRSEDQGRTWTLLPGKRPGGWFAEGFDRMDEGRPIALGAGEVFALFRTPEGHLWSARSGDDGRSWSKPSPTPLVHPDAPPMLFPLSDGKTLVAFHHNRHAQTKYEGLTAKMEGMKDRSEVWAATSSDGGRTWSEPGFLLANVVKPDLSNAWFNHQCSYMDAFTDGGILHLFMPHRWQQVMHLTIAERALGGLPTAREIAESCEAVGGAVMGAGGGVAVEADVCVYGGTSGGVVAAVQAARMGKRVVIAEPGKHLGGMTAGGLAAVDIGDPRSVGGIAREYFTKLAGRYGKQLAWDQPFKGHGGGPATGGAYSIEPHVAEEVFEEMVRDAGVAVHRNARLVRVRKEGARIVEATMEDGASFRARMFIDATYEGDLMAKAGVGYTLEREGNAKYGETYNGIHYSEIFRPRTEHAKPGANGRTPSGQGVWDRDLPLDPYVVAGDPKSGLLPLISAGDPGAPGERAAGVQAYCYRLCLTTNENRIPIAPPADYDAKRYEVVARFIAGCRAIGDDMDLRWFSKHDALPNGKWDFNTATFGGNLPGASWEWPEADYARRAQIAREHEDYHRGLLHFLATDQRVPDKVRGEMGRFGLPSDEFKDNGGWPHQIYVREARRMVSDLVMTEHHTFGRQAAPNSIGLGSYGTDTHEIRRIVKDGVVCREGKTATGRGGAPPYPIGYGSIVPKATECGNLFVTFALSASHTAFSSIRMEPVFMVLGQSAATAACLAIDGGIAVQAVDYGQLRVRLVGDGQVLEWAGEAAAARVPPPASAAVQGKARDPIDEMAAALEPTRVVVYKKVGNRDLHLSVFEPPGLRAGDRRPCLVTIHGGGWTGLSPRRQYPVAAHFAKLGMVAISVEYRLVQKGSGTTVFECVKDARTAVRYVRAHAAELGVDPERIVVNGGSAGGHLAAGTALFDGIDEEGDDRAVSCVPNALVLYFPVIDTSAEGYGNAKCGPRWEEVSPLHRVRRGVPPTIVFHGTGDTVTPFKGARAFEEAMRRAGNRCELVIHEGGAHGYLMRDRGIFDDTMRQTAEFLRSLHLLEGGGR